MAEETKAPETPATAEESETAAVVVEKKEAAAAEAESAEKAAELTETKEEVAAPETESPEKAAEVTESGSFKEESNKVEELPNPEKKALEELKAMVKEALNKHEFTPNKPTPPPPAKEEEKKPEEDKKETEHEPAMEEPKEVTPPAPEEEKKEEEKLEEDKKETEPEPAKEVTPPAPEEEKETVAAEAEPSEKAEEKTETATEVIKETIVEAAEETEEKPQAEPEEKEVTAEEVSIWGIPLLADERTDVILLKFLRARDFKVKEAFAMLKNVITWRREFKADELIEEELGQGLNKVVYINGFDKEGHPVCYNAFGEFQDKELYQNTFADKEKLNRFLRWRIQFMEKSIRNLDFSPEGINTFVQVIDLKNSPGLFFFKKELRQATNRALQLLQDNYPEFVAKQIFINVPWWYPAYHKMINALFTTRTKSKFVFAGPSKCAETLFKYIAPEQVPVQYGGLSREGDYEFTTGDSAAEDTIKPTSKHTIEIPVTEKCTLVWEARVIGWDVSYGSEFVPAAEGAYTIIVEKSRKIGASDETIIGNTYKTDCVGKVVLTFDNQTSKRKKVLYRYKIKPSD